MSTSGKGAKNKAGGGVKRGGSLKNKQAGGNTTNGGGNIAAPYPKRSSLKVITPIHVISILIIRYMIINTHIFNRHPDEIIYDLLFI